MTAPALEPFDMLRHREECTQPIGRGFVGYRGDAMLCCLTCHASAPFNLLARQLRGDDVVSTRYSLTCVRCETRIHLHSPKPRVPLCKSCSDAHHRARRPKKEND